MGLRGIIRKIAGKRRSPHNSLDNSTQKRHKISAPLSEKPIQNLSNIPNHIRGQPIEITGSKGAVRTHEVEGRTSASGSNIVTTQVSDDSRLIDEDQQTNTSTNKATDVSTSQLTPHNTYRHIGTDMRDGEPVDRYLDALETELIRCIEDCKKGDPEKPVIFPVDVKEIWKPACYRDFYTFRPWYKSEWNRSCMLDDYLTILTILIYIRFRDWDQFANIFINNDAQNRQDRNLPFDENKLRRDDFIGPKFSDSFFNAQWMFCPIRIQERREPYRLRRKQLLPYTKSQRLIGWGGFSKVTEGEVAADFLESCRNGYRTVNPKPKLVAIKTIRDQKIERDELDNLKNLRHCLSHHNRIMVNLATIIEDESDGTQVHRIIYELAAYDLEKVLNYPPSELRAKRHDSAPNSRTNSLHMTSRDFITESCNLADALDYLHNRLYHTERIAIAHNDIKPENILVFYPDSIDPEVKYPVGKWKLADFGVSKIKPMRPRQSSGMDTLSPEGTAVSAPMDRTRRNSRDISISKTTPGRDPGRYTAPEQDQLRATKIGGREADIWSFGCVLSEILTYAAGGDPNLVQKFRNRLGHDSPDMRFYDYRNEDKDVKKAFSDFLTELQTQKPNQKWVAETSSLLKDIVVRDPKKRPKADTIRDRLQIICSNMKSQDTFWILKESPHRLDTSVTSEPAAYSPGPEYASVTQSPVEGISLDFPSPKAGEEERLALHSHGRHPSITISDHGSSYSESKMNQGAKSLPPRGSDTWP